MPRLPRIRPYLAAYVSATAFAFGSLPGVAAAADTVPQNDLLNAELWMQKSVEYKANSLAVYALAKVRLDEALADKKWTAATEQSGDYGNLPPAIILDADETVVDNSAYEAGLITSGADYSSKTWDTWTRAEKALAVPGAVEFTRYADSRGVKVFYVSNREADQEDATRKNMEALGFPMGGNVDTFLMSKEQPNWGSAKGSRRAFVARDYRVLLLLGDNFGDFTDNFRGSDEDRLKAFRSMQAHFGHDWLMLANPVYGSFESAPFNGDYKLPADEKRRKKIEALEPWTPPAK
ncbi:acid phosphatase [Faunimonas pinastri]|uniref:Acid phosphatase n=1 Tax=Faunimonas pinastri TaxID=1855383 RepID=A0A1H9AG05_9HYPH|nr:HAD family acid phosphatase [Faunimonas pinastri]SEP75353.1 acid phosphatase [Faunimonas pinastri]